VTRRPPNLLVIMPDQLRATALGLYGNQLVRTPHLEALAGSGALFRHAFTPYPVCVPARVAFWTGRWPHLTGSRSNSVYLQPGEVHLLQLLRDAGYRTGLIGKNHCFTEPDVARYFDTYYAVGHGGPADDGGDPEVAAAKQWVRRLEADAGGQVRRMGGGNGAAYAAGISPFPVEKHGTWLIGEQAEAFLRASRDRPFCAWVSIPDPHTPYQVSEPYASRYPPGAIELPPHEPPGYAGKPDRVRLFAELLGAPEVTDDHLRFVLSIYYGMIAVIDEVVGRLMATLDRLGLREDTIVVFTSDHGDYMTEHRLVRKGASLYDSLVRVPLIISYPRSVAAGTVVDDLVSVLDVFPTLTRFMDLPLPAGRSGQALPQIAGGPPREVVFAESGIEGALTTREAVRRRLAELEAAGLRRPLPWQLIANGKLKMARTREWKYVYAPGGEDELYHLTEDPYELVNLAGHPDQRERVQDFRRLLLDWAITSEDTLPVPERVPDRGV
jgi:arylsulfatase A-like enzyme